jgi:hypothetical protein
VRKATVYGLTIERGTERVPADGKYHVIHNGVVVYSSGSDTLADVHFDMLREKIQAETGSDPRRVLRQEAAFSDIMGVKAESKERRTTGERAKGGKGGRSGV